MLFTDTLNFDTHAKFEAAQNVKFCSFMILNYWHKIPLLSLAGFSIFNSAIAFLVTEKVPVHTNEEIHTLIFMTGVCLFIAKEVQRIQEEEDKGQKYV